MSRLPLKSWTLSGQTARKASSRRGNRDYHSRINKRTCSSLLGYLGSSSAQRANFQRLLQLELAPVKLRATSTSRSFWRSLTNLSKLNNPLKQRFKHYKIDCTVHRVIRRCKRWSCLGGQVWWSLANLKVAIRHHRLRSHKHPMLQRLLHWTRDKTHLSRQRLFNFLRRWQWSKRRYLCTGRAAARQVRTISMRWTEATKSSMRDLTLI